jgi:hypothetical protein
MPMRLLRVAPPTYNSRAALPPHWCGGPPFLLPHSRGGGGSKHGATEKKRHNGKPGGTLSLSVETLLARRRSLAAGLAAISAVGRGPNEDHRTVVEDEESVPSQSSPANFITSHCKLL